MFGAGALVAFADLGIFTFLLRSHNPPALHEFHNATLGRVSAYDGTKGAELIQTLEAYFASRCSPDATAKRLHLHRNSLLYRLRRIEEIAGVRLDDPETRLSIAPGAAGGSGLAAGAQRDVIWRSPQRALEHVRVRFRSGTAGAAGYWSGDMLVLVAHSDRWTRLLVRDVVVEAGSAVVEASNGMSALRLAQQTQPDLVLLGPTLSEIAPGEVLGLLRADLPTRGIPVLMLRANGLMSRTLCTKGAATTQT